jgi:hypothetical protein
MPSVVRQPSPFALFRRRNRPVPYLQPIPRTSCPRSRFTLTCSPVLSPGWPWRPSVRPCHHSQLLTASVACIMRELLAPAYRCEFPVHHTRACYELSHGWRWELVFPSSRRATNMDYLRATIDNEMGKIGPSPPGCGANWSILRCHPRRWARHRLRIPPRLDRFSSATPPARKFITGSRNLLK